MNGIQLLARAVDSAVFQSLMLAYEAHRNGDSSAEIKWMNHADKLERKFTTQHGRHYSKFLEKVE